jgi:Tfp pilus assembly protein PilF
MEYFPSVLWHLKDTIALEEIGNLWMQDPATAYLSALAHGNLFSLKNDHELAIKSFSRAAMHKPNHTLPFLLRAHEFLMIGDVQTAQECFSEALHINPICGKALYVQ